MKTNSFEVVPSVHYAPETEKQPSKKKKQNNSNKKTNKEQANKKLRGLNNLT